MSIVSCVKVDQNSVNPKSVFMAVRKAMELASWKKYVQGKKLVLKVNVVWDRLYPSCTTTPMVIEGILKTILESKKFEAKNIVIADTDTAAIMHADVAFKVLGIENLAKKYGVSVINLSQTDFKEVLFKNALILHKLKISKVLLEADTIITVPVLKTHSYSTMTGALKNQWGCIHDLRHNYHMVLNKAIADVNNFFKSRITFAVMDGLFGMEGQGPKTGTPRKIGYVFASPDRVSLDTAVAQVMGLDPQKIRHITYAKEVGVGTMDIKVVGHKLPKFNFKTAEQSNIVMATEMWLRHLGPKVEWFMFNGKSPILPILRWSAKIYYDVWYFLIGIKNAQKMMKTNYGKMWDARYLKTEDLK
ncbi:MAG: hypothetical protein UV07_C0003G0018 [Candidatus Azambacteria bacterium GW2011_GWB1_42_17]|uniref:DUF362 domain-containing protein n=1 Tax=Candidatus Azambacteria bacterium GW2011_GWB1_42_17 TaxID=1618615 RepID=A0A0G1C563_9BACT|nr:MAG: hypothetical protein UV07_C0003G0018 [Candidatus Azambacteria bacterium GW2011_GWB1_42_17]